MLFVCCEVSGQTGYAQKGVYGKRYYGKDTIQGVFRFTGGGPSYETSVFYMDKDGNLKKDTICIYRSEFDSVKQNILDTQQYTYFYYYNSKDTSTSYKIKMKKYYPVKNN